MNSRRKFLVGVAVVAAGLASPLSLSWDDAYAAYLPVTQPTWNALDYNIKGDGTTDDSIAINQFLANATVTGAACWFPGARTYLIGTSQILVPQGSNVVASATATFTRNADPGTAGSTWTGVYNAATGAAFSGGSNSHWVGGIITNTATLGTSTTSNPATIGSKTFTVGAGLNIAVGNFLRIQSNSAAATHLEGTVTSYSGTTLIVNIAFANGTTHNDWTIYSTGVWQAAYTLNNANGATVDLLTVQGNYYVGIILSGWNSTGSALITQNCKIDRCSAVGIMNRGFYQYGTNAQNTFDSCYVDGLLGETDYGFNNNAANLATNNTIQHTSIINAHVVNTGSQGITFGDLCFYNTITSPDINGVLSSAGVGILITTANNGGANAPQFTYITNPNIKSAAGQGIFLAGTLYCNISGGGAILCGTGLQLSTGGSNVCNECSWIGCLIASCTVGISVGASQANTLLMGRAVGNTTNLSNAGSGTNSTGLIFT